MSKEVLQEALELLAVATFITPKLQAKRTEVINAGLQALEQPAQQEPVAWRWLYNGQPDSKKHFSMPGPDAEVISRASACEFPRTVQYLYTSPPAQRTWVGLSPADRGKCLSAGDAHGWIGVMEATEAKLKEKNT